jgi:hypothetical protein
LLGLQARGDLGNDSDQAGRVTSGIVEHASTQVDPVQAAIRPEHSRFQRHAAGGERLRVRCRDDREIFGQDVLPGGLESSIALAARGNRRSGRDAGNAP